MIVAAVWAAALALVAWGPAHNSDVHTGSAGFWVRWLVVLALSCAIVFGVTAWREHRATAARP